MNKIKETTVLANRLLFYMLAQADVHDAYEAAMVDPELSPTEIFLAPLAPRQNGSASPYRSGTALCGWQG